MRFEIRVRTEEDHATRGGAPAQRIGPVRLAGRPIHEDQVEGRVSRQLKWRINAEEGRVRGGRRGIRRGGCAASGLTTPVESAVTGASAE